ncbi:MAG: DUF2254 domain-containing protein [Gammaproteobacteria bacterium]
MIPAVRLRQWWADLRASFWLRPAVMVLIAVCLSEALVRAEGWFELPDWLSGWVYAGGAAGARDVLGAMAGAMIAVAGTTFSITVAALTLASTQMGPRLLRNFTRDPGNQYALGALVATFAYAVTALRSVHQADEAVFVPQIAVSVGLLLTFSCIGVLIWFIHHVATSINVDRVVALVHGDLIRVLRALPETSAQSGDEDDPDTQSDGRRGPGAGLQAMQAGYLRVLDDGALADWAEENDALIELSVRPGQFIFPCSIIGTVWPEDLREQAQEVLVRAMALGDARDVEQDLEFAVRQLVEVGLRALSPGVNDPFTAIAVLDRLGAALCELAGRRLPGGRIRRHDRIRLDHPVTDYNGLLDAMFHMMRQSGTTVPAVMIRMLEVLSEVAAVEPDPLRRQALLQHAEWTHAMALDGTQDVAARRTIAERHAGMLHRLQQPTAAASA